MKRNKPPGPEDQDVDLLGWGGGAFFDLPQKVVLIAEGSMLRTEERKADCLLPFLSHLLLDPSLLCFESKAWLLTTFPFQKDCLGAGLFLSPVRKTSLYLSGFL